MNELMAALVIIGIMSTIYLLLAILVLWVNYDVPPRIAEVVRAVIVLVVLGLVLLAICLWGGVRW